MPKDSELLRDLIWMWDPENFLGKASRERSERYARMEKAAADKRAKQLDAAWAKKQRLQRLGRPIPKKLEHFLRGGIGHTRGEAPRRFSSGIIGL